MVGGALNIRVYIVVMEMIIDRGALIIIKKARMLFIRVLSCVGGDTEAGGAANVNVI